MPLKSVLLIDLSSSGTLCESVIIWVSLACTRVDFVGSTSPLNNLKWPEVPLFFLSILMVERVSLIRLVKVLRFWAGLSVLNIFLYYCTFYKPDLSISVCCPCMHFFRVGDTPALSMSAMVCALETRVWPLVMWSGLKSEYRCSMMRLRMFERPPFRAELSWTLLSCRWLPAFSML